MGEEPLLGTHVVVYHDESQCFDLSRHVSTPSRPGPFSADGTFETHDGLVSCVPGFVNVTCFVS